MTGPVGQGSRAGHLLIWLAVALLVLLAIPAAIVRRRLGERRRARAPAPKPQLPPLERALQLLEWANSRREGSDRRRALELVAVELSRGGRSDLSTEARALAWQARTGLSACFCGVLFLK